MKKSAQWRRTLTGIPDYIDGRMKWNDKAAAVPTHNVCSERHLLKGTKFKVGRELALPIKSTDSNKLGLYYKFISLIFHWL